MSDHDEPEDDVPDRDPDATGSPSSHDPLVPVESLGGQRHSVNLRVPLVDGLPPLQHRWTIAIRILLVIPQAIVLIFVALATYVVAIIAWFAALATGRVPVGLASFMATFVRWSTRVSAYATLLTELYPPFDGERRDDYPIDVELPALGPLNRLAVLFRLVLAIPMYVVATVLQAGMFSFMFFFWIAALILGRLPDPVYRTVAVVIRFGAREAAYLLMLTPEYPWGWRGDASASSQSSSDGDDYWTKESVVTTPAVRVDTTSYDFHLTGWSTAWLWIFIVVGALSNLRTRHY